MDLSQLFLWSLVGADKYSSFSQALSRYLPDFHSKNMHLIQDFAIYDHKDEMIKKTENYIELLRNFIKNQEPQHLLNMEGLFALSGQYFLNKNAFLSTIQMLGSPEQVQFWEDKVLNGRVIGAYAQTEVGHGSDVQKLETRADFDENSKCFLLNSPKISSTKLWAGLLGTLATHCVIQAQTYIKGKYVGLQTFVLQVRNVLTYSPLEGVVAGDQGPKLGFLGVDNGFMNLKNARVPVENFLMRYSTVTKDGTFIPPKDKNAAKYGYGSMLNLRVSLVKGFTYNGLLSSAIAYTQSSKDCLSPYFGETHKDLFLLRSFAYGFGMLLTGSKLNEIFNQYNQELSEGNPQVKQTLNEIHVLSASFKAFCGWKSVDLQRESLHVSPIGFLKMSGLPMFYGNNVPYNTYEGDNSVLTQQTARFLLKEIQKLQNPSPKLAKCTSFFKNCFDKPHSDFLIKNKEDFLNSNKLETLFEYLGFLNTRTVAEEFANVLMQGVPSKSVWNEKKLVDLINASLTFISVINYKFSKEILASIKEKLEGKTYNIVFTLLNLMGVEMIEEHANKLLFYGLIDKNYRQIVNEIRSEVAVDLKRAIPQLVDLLKLNGEGYFLDKLIEKFDFSKKYREYFGDFAENARELSKQLNLDSRL